MASATAMLALPKWPVAPLTSRISPARRSDASSPPYGTSSVLSAHQRAASADAISPMRTAFSVGTRSRSANGPS